MTEPPFDFDLGDFTAGDVNLAFDEYDPAVDCHCQECGAQFNGSDSSGGHCKGGRFGGCCQSFTSLTGFDRHRTGPYTDRRCLTPDELTAKGWTRDEHGAWRTPAPKTNPWKKDDQ